MESRCLRTRWARRCAPCGTQAHGCDIPAAKSRLASADIDSSAQRGANLVGVRGGSDVAAPIILPEEYDKALFHIFRNV